MGVVVGVARGSGRGCGGVGAVCGGRGREGEAPPAPRHRHHRPHGRRRGPGGRPHQVRPSLLLLLVTCVASVTVACIAPAAGVVPVTVTSIPPTASVKVPGPVAYIDAVFDVSPVDKYC